MKKITKRGIGKILITLSLTALFLPFFALGLTKALKTVAAAPRFNFMGAADGDKELLTLSKTGSAGSWTDPVSASPGEEVFMAIYYHNGGDAPATNTTIKTYLPTTFSNTLVTKTGIKSDQTAEIFKTTKTNSTEEWGKPDGTINVLGNVPSKLEFVSGSVKWWIRDTNQPGWPLKQVPLPNGQNGDTLVQAQGINIGTANACWQFAGFVTFKVKLTGGAPSGVAQKWVALTGTGIEDWKKDLTTAPGNFLDFLVFYNNTGTATATGVKVTDTLLNKLSYVPNQAIWRWKDDQGNEHTDPVAANEVLIEGQKITFSYPRNVANKDSAAFFLRFRVKIADAGQFPPDSTTNLTNVAQITSSNGVNISTDQVIIRVVNPPTPTIVFQVDKTADNASHGDANDPWLDYTTAAPGETMAFKIDVINEGTAEARNVTVKDALPAEMTYINGSTQLFTIDNQNGTTLPDGIVGNGVSISTIAATAQISIKFKAIIKTDMPSGVTRLVNTGIVPVDSWNSINWIEAKDITTIDVSSTKSLLIDKRVWNGTTYTNDDTRYEEGDTVWYHIVISNNGNDLAKNIVLWDELPPFTEYIWNSTKVDGIPVQDEGDSIITKNGLKITNLAPGIQKIITFQAKVLDCPPLGDQRLVNTANATADNVAKISDSVAILVKVDAPPLPNL